MLGHVECRAPVAPDRAPIQTPRSRDGGAFGGGEHTAASHRNRRCRHGFALVERSISLALRKQYHVAWDDLVKSSAALVAVHESRLLGVAGLEYVAPRRS